MCNCVVYMPKYSVYMYKYSVYQSGGFVPKSVLFLVVVLNLGRLPPATRRLTLLLRH